MDIKRITLSLFATFTVLTACAVKAVSIPKVITLNDGTQTLASMRGDENVSFLVDSVGDIILQEGTTFRKATTEEVNTLKEECARNEQRNQEAKAKMINGRYINSTTYDMWDKKYKHFPHMGNPRVLVIMAEFQDVRFSIRDRERWEDYLNSSNTRSETYKNYGSVAEYFNYSSHGKFRPQFDIYGIVTLSQNLAYYGANEGSSKDHMERFIPEVCKLAKSQYDINFADYDQDNDGYVDLVYVIYAGFGEHFIGNSTDCIWPKAGYSYFDFTIDGKKFQKYGVSNELLGYPDTFPEPYINGIGTFCHEFSHCLGLTDFYTTVNWSPTSLYNNQSMEEWDIMDGGSNTYYTLYPIPYTAFERELMGWTDPIPVIKDPSYISLEALNYGGNAVKIVNDVDPTEFYILESLPKQTTGWYKKIPNNGMIVTHIYWDEKDFSYGGHPNNNQGRPRITVIPADGILISSYDEGSSNEYNGSLMGDPFPGTSRVTSITDWKSYASNGMTGKTVTDITQVNNTQISFTYMGGGQGPVGDADGDGVVTRRDANEVVDIYLGKKECINIPGADANQDGYIDMKDANTIVNMLQK